MTTRRQLAVLVEACGTCRATLRDNAPLLVAEDDGVLTDAQVDAVLTHLRQQHEGHSMTYKRISVLVPTRNRTHRLRTLIDSYQRTTSGDPSASELVFRIDEDDIPSRTMLLREGYRMVVGQRLGGYDSLPQFFNELAAVAYGDVLMLGNDDMVFRTDGWATRLLRAANDYPDGLFDLGVRTHNESHFPFATVSKRVCEQLGHLSAPDIFWVDIYLRDVMAAFGRCVMVQDVEIDHDWAGHAPDQTFREGHRDVVAKRPDYWTRCHPNAVSSAVAKLQELRQ